MPDGPCNSVILRAATRPSDVEAVVSASADEGLHVWYFGSEAQPAHTRNARPGTANRRRRPLERGEGAMAWRLRIQTRAGSKTLRYGPSRHSLSRKGNRHH